MAFRVAITGGARGIGLATAEAFARAGAEVTIADVDAEAGVGAAERAGVAFRELDVRDAEAFGAFADAAGPLDVLVNNAGVAYAGPFLDTPPAMRDLQIDVNLRGVVNGMGAVLPGMVARGRGHVVNVASLAGKLATPNAAVYTAAKHAVVGLTEAVRAEIHDSGVRVSAVLPTFVPTDMTSGLSLASVPVIEPDVVAAAILRVVRRGGPALVPVPRWMGGVPRLAAFTPQAVLDWMRHGFSGDLPDADPARRAYQDRLRGLVRRPQPDQ